MSITDDRQGRVPFEFIREKFSKANPEIMAKNTFSELIGSTIHMRFMGRAFKVEYPSGTILDEDNKELEFYTVRTLFLRFLVNGQGIEPTGKDITYKDIPGGLVYYPNFSKRTINRLSKNYGNDLSKFDEDMKSINAMKLDQGDRAYKFHFMNETYMSFIIWEEDEEFPSTANILFDQNIQFYFDAEDLAVVPDVAIDIIKNKGIIPEWIGLYQKKTQ